MNHFRIAMFSVLVLLISLWLTPVAHAARINSNQLEALVVTSLKLILTEDFEGVAMLYHYPPDYTKDQLDADLHAVENSLKIFNEEFGKFGSVAPLDTGDLYVNIYATSASHQYWDKQEKAYKVELETEFKNYGAGYLVIQLIDIIGTLEIKAIAYGLPVSGESVGRIKKVGEKMMLLNPQAEKPEAVESTTRSQG